jgi:flavodoxin
MGRVLAVFFSRTGATQLVAHRVAHAGEWDCEALRDHEWRGGILGYLRSGYEATFGRSVAIEPLEHGLADYDLVIIGTPVWNHAVASPVRAFLERYRERLARVAFFVTCGDSGGGRVLQQMAALAGKEPVATMIVKQREIETGPFGEIEHFVLKIEHEMAMLDRARRLATRAPERTA